MQAPWAEEDEEFRRLMGQQGGLRSKPRFSFSEVKLLLEEVKKNRYIVLKKFNHGVSADDKKKMWADITTKINSLGENHREVRQIMKKWADLKCDGRRRMAALRGPNGSSLRKKNLGPVEKMVHKILMMSPGKEFDSDLDLDTEAPKQKVKGQLQLSFSPAPSPDKEPFDSFRCSPDLHFDLLEDDEPMNGEEDENGLMSPNTLLKSKPIATYSRNTSFPTPPPPPPISSFSSNGTTSHSSSSMVAPPIPSSSSSSFPPASHRPHLTTPPSSGPPAAPRGPGVMAQQPGPQVALIHQPGTQVTLPQVVLTQQALPQVALQSLQQQQASRALLNSLSGSLEVLAQSVQQLVQNQQNFVQQSLLLQRDTLEVLRDFSTTAMAMLKDKPSNRHREVNPQNPENSKNPEERQNSQNPEDAKKAENPQEAKKAENPQEAKKAENPQEAKKAENPQEAKKAENPQEAKKAENPQDSQNPEDARPPENQQTNC